jgi:hypothetical protein
MANKKNPGEEIKASPEKKKHVLAGIEANIKPLVIDGRTIDTSLDYYSMRNGQMKQAKTPYSVANFINEPIKALKINAGFQARTNATEEQMQFIFKTPFTELVKIEKSLKNVK